MGRTLKRVPLDFNWPINTTWGGYLNPHYVNCADCPQCEGSGYSPDAKRFSDEWYGNAQFDPVEYGATPLTVDHPSVQAFARRNCERHPGYYGSGEQVVQREAQRLFDHWRGQWSHHLIQADVDALIADGRLWDFTRVARTDEQRAIVAQKIADGGNCWTPEPNGYTPTADEVNAWSIGGFGHDSINQWVCVTARCEREGIAKGCSHCAGKGSIWSSATAEAECEAWEETEPPTGDGFQLWETTSEGSPYSPVFSTIEELCAWCADNANTFGSEKASAEKWREMLDKGFVHHAVGNAVFL